MTMEIILMICFLMLAHSVESVLGFGATIIAFGLGAHLMPVDRLVVILVLIALIQSAFLVIRWWKHIEWGSILRFILPVALAGVIGGILLRNLANEGMLKLILGVFIICLSALELFYIVVNQHAQRRELHFGPGFLLVLFGGILHGLLAIGGPLIVYYAGRKISSQESVRGTLSFIWIILNLAMLAGFIINGRITADILVVTVYLLPGLILGIIIGHRLRMSDRVFKGVTYALLLLVGVTLVLP